MKLKSSIVYAIILILVVAVFGGFYIYKEYNRTNKNLADVKPDFSVLAINLLSEFITNDSIATQKYLGKIVEVDGIIKEITRDENGSFSISIGDTLSMSSVRCRLDSSENEKVSFLKRGAVLLIKGSCTGFMADEFGIGSDVLLDRCVLPAKKN